MGAEGVEPSPIRLKAGCAIRYTTLPLWYQRRDSNPRYPPCKGSVFAAKLRWHVFTIRYSLSVSTLLRASRQVFFIPAMDIVQEKHPLPNIGSAALTLTKALTHTVNLADREGLEPSLSRFGSCCAYPYTTDLWCRRRESNPHACARDSKSRVSAYFTTPAEAHVGVEPTSHKLTACRFIR